MHVVQLNYAVDDELTDPEGLLARYESLTGWAEALVSAGVDRMTVFQRFRRDARVVRNGIEYAFCRGSRLHRAIAGAQPDVVHVNGLNFPARTWLLRRALAPATAIVVQDHGGNVPNGRSAPVQRALRRPALRAADAFLFAAAERAKSWQRAGMIPSNRHVYDVMEASTTFKPMPRADARQASGVDGNPALLWVARLNANKDPMTILNGFEQSLVDLPAARLTMVYGQDDLLPAIRERVRTSALLRDRVRLVGRVSRELMPAFYSAADIFAIGSHDEGSGYALIEACACGVVPVVTDIPTFRVITAAGSLGALWPAGDARAFARALVRVAHADDLQARARVLEHFGRTLSWQAIGRSAIEAYRDVLARRRACLSDT
jgi:glycosyltransferase involved in cell wall biosynthesis